MIDIDSKEIEPAAGPTVAALVPVQAAESSLVRPAAQLDAIVEAFHDYQELYTRLLTDSDFQVIAGKRFPKKSAWRKLSVAFGVTFSIKEREYERNAAGRIIRAEFIVTATAPNGRFAEGFGACDLFEKCCQPGCTKGGRHKHCAPECPGSIHFSNPQHDLPATAETRAKNRAASDLFGMGEVSAEEMTHYEDGWWAGWVSKEECQAAHDPLVEQLRAAPTEVQKRAREWREERQLKLPMPKDDFTEFRSFATQLIVEAQQEHDPDVGDTDAAGTGGGEATPDAPTAHDGATTETALRQAPEATPTAAAGEETAPPPPPRTARSRQQAADAEDEEQKAKVQRQALWAACRGAGLRDDSDGLHTFVRYVSRGRTTSRGELTADECVTGITLLDELQQGSWKWANKDGQPVMVDARTGQELAA